MFYPIIIVLQIQILLIQSHVNQNLICDNFYQYACNDWMQSQTKPDSEPFWNVYTETAQKISQTLQGILENDSFTNINNEKALYKACVQTNTDYIKELRFFVNKLGGIQQNHLKNNRYDYLMHIIEVTKLLDIHPILKFSVKLNNLHIERGDFVFPELFLLNPDLYKSELTVYTAWIEKSLSLMNVENKETNFITSLMRGSKYHTTNAVLAKEIVTFEAELVKLKRGKLTKINTFGHRLALEFLYERIETKHNQTREDVYIDELYFDELNKLLKTTHWRHISNYIVWSAIKSVSRDVNNDFRQLSFNVDKELIGVSADINRKRECVDLTLDYIGHENLQQNFELTTAHNHKLMIKHVNDLANEIRHTFLSSVQFNDKLSKKTKSLIMKKITSVKFEILGPEFSQTNERHVKLGKNHFVNILRLKSAKFQRKFDSYNLKKLENDKSMNIQWPGNIFDVNAFYSPAQNAIILPLGILQPPFFDLQEASAFNYGALGTLIGHEFSHVLDNINQENFAPEDLNLFQLRGKCITEMFGLHLDGNLDSSHLALNENIADFTGIRLSYLTMRNKHANNVFLEDNDDHLFFLNYAKMWCELSDSNSKEMLAQDEHAPVVLRVMKTLDNFPTFLKTFHCTQKLNEAQHQISHCEF